MGPEPPGETEPLKKPEPEGCRDQPSGAVEIPWPPASTARILRRGEVTDLLVELTTWGLLVSWTLANPPLDVVSFVTDAEDRVLSDGHFVFFNVLKTRSGEV
jgi:stress response protein SCP2